MKTEQPRLRVGSIVIRVDDLATQPPSGRPRSTTCRATATTTTSPSSSRAAASARTSRSTRSAPASTIPPRIHLDLYAEDQAAEVERLKALGATEVHWDKRPADADYVIMADPEGNRFCVIDPRR